MAFTQSNPTWLEVLTNMVYFLTLSIFGEARLCKVYFPTNEVYPVKSDQWSSIPFLWVNLNNPVKKSLMLVCLVNLIYWLQLIHGYLNDRVSLYFLAILTFREVGWINLADSQVDLSDREVQMGMVSTQFALALNATLTSMASTRSVPIFCEGQYVWC